MQGLRKGVVWLLMAAGLLVVAPAVSGQQPAEKSDVEEASSPNQLSLGRQGSASRYMEATQPRLSA